MYSETPTQKRALLLCAIADEAYRVYDSLPVPVKSETGDEFTVTVMFNDFSLTAREPTPDLRGPPWLEGFEILKGFSYFCKLLWLQLMAYKSHNAPSY